MAEKPIRILQVLSSIAGGGVGVWLLNVMRRLSPRYQFDFIVFSPEPPKVVREIEAHGGRLLLCDDPHRPWALALRFVKLLRRHGPYDIVHCHLFTYSGLIVYLAYIMNVQQRIVHSHTDTSLNETGHSNLFRSVYLALMKKWIRAYATHCLAISKAAAKDLFGDTWLKDGRVRIIHCGIDLSNFGDLVEPIAFRQELNLPPDAFVVGHVGRFIPLKNHVFILTIAQELLKREPRAYFLLVGNGPLRQEMENLAHQQGIHEHVRFLGLRDDVPRLLLRAMDVVILPSWYEGLPLILLEAQAAGRPCLFSDIITEEAEVVFPLIKRLSLTQPAAEWAKALIFLKELNLEVNRKKTSALFEKSPFNIETSVAELEKVYKEARLTPKEYNE
jgi:glycosyltransferase involved in cell wall biosynthesis